MPRRLTENESRRRFAEGRALWNVFDPIGVFSFDPPGPPDEYESYVGPSLRLCEAGKSIAELQTYVDYVVFERIGLSKTEKKSHAIVDFAEKFFGWYQANWSDVVV